MVRKNSGPTEHLVCGSLDSGLELPLNIGRWQPVLLLNQPASLVPQYDCPTSSTRPLSKMATRLIFEGYMYTWGSKVVAVHKHDATTST
jgi:hypothetical protein